jgi:hypothetical protein
MVYKLHMLMLNTIKPYNRSKLKTLKFKIYKSKINKFKINPNINKIFIRLLEVIEICILKSLLNLKNKQLN